ncbi:MAG: hypothetical protein RMJ13_07810, partial [Elusimicrobiota bacterium]|nr:hypothetical protein [Elusimicrobiota bacterium]
RTYWFFEFDPIPSGNIKFESFYLSVTVPTFNVPTRYYIRFSQTIEKELKDRPVEIIWVEWTIKVFNTITGGVLYTYSKRDTYNRRYERGIIGLSLRAINCILDIKSFAYCFGFYDEIVYEFSTPNVYSYLTSYENSLGTAEYKASKSDRDTKSILIQNGKILSIPGERIKIYYFSYPTIPARYQFLGDDILSVECPPLEVREKIYLTYTTIDEQDVEQGIVEVKNPKNLVYLITTAYDNQSLITNQVLLKNYGYYFSNQKLIEDSFVLTQEYNRTFITEAIDPQSCRLQLIVQGIGQWNYRPGEYYNDDAKLRIKFFVTTLQIQLVLTPTESLSRDVRIEITADKLMIKYKNEQVINHNESQLKYGVITKNIDNKKIISEFQIVNIAKKYLRFSNLPCELLAENINLPLSIDIDFSKFVQIYDEIQQKRLQIKLFEYEHYIDLINNEYETTIKGRLMLYEQYRININYWGNNDYWGDNPPKYWGGEYYG